MNKMNVIKHPQFGEVRSMTKNGDTWFVAKDVCDVLELLKYRDAVARLDNDERGCPLIVDTLGGNQEMSTINESGLYSLIFQSRKPEAKAFRKWVTSEVLPAIRRQGFYVSPSAELTVAERNKLERVMRESVKKYVTAGDKWECHKKLRVDTYKIDRVLTWSVVDMAVMADLQERAMVNRERLDAAYSLDRMQEVVKVLNQK